VALVPLAVTLRAVPHAAMKYGALLATFVITKVGRQGCGMAYGQTQTQQAMPPAEAQFTDNNGVAGPGAAGTPQLSSGINGLDFPNSTVPTTDSNGGLGFFREHSFPTQRRGCRLPGGRPPFGSPLSNRGVGGWFESDTDQNYCRPTKASAAS
jgi:hypothetical protein